MADRVSGEGDPDVPKEVFELDKDERWQARLEEARARREVALREKAAGKPKKPRPKPWEIEGSGVDAPKPIEPIIQERGDDKFDFADRLETIKDTKPAAEEPKPVTPEPAAEAPPFVPKREKVPQAKPASARTPPPGDAPPMPTAAETAPEPRARPQPSLILPGAPDVADIAARYAATLDAPEDEWAADVEMEAEQGRVMAFPAPVPDPEPKPEYINKPVRKLSRYERRRGIRPLGMAFGLLILAALPLSTKAPPLETGPKMPVLSRFWIEPALGVTWSLGNRPAATDAARWRPESTVPALFAPDPPLSGFGALSVAELRVPALSTEALFSWEPMRPAVVASPPPDLPPASDRSGVPVIEPAPKALSGPPEAAIPSEILPNVSPPPRQLTPPSIRAIQPDPRPGATRDEAKVAPESALRVTVLAPPQGNKVVADDIAEEVRTQGHELVRVKPVDFNINTRNVRYFHEADRASAARLAERYDAELRDFTWFRPRPVEGTAELWLVGRGSGTFGNTTDGGRVKPSLPLGLRVPLERAFERLGLGRELPRVLSPSRSQGSN
ncbi:MAG: hypothetical protein QNJ20_05000 [Paracoccaceae bacterium]|nr:hypothetical protein [Paracoccaceae bacterium]